MKKQLLKNQLPILVSIQATDKIQKVQLMSHPEGFAYQLEGSFTQHLSNQIVEFLECYIARQPSCFSVLDWLENCTPFTKQVLHFLTTIPFGKTLKYGEIASMLNSPNSARAVGGACGRNPFPLFIPCHRVLSTKGLGGFSEGIEIKRNLLDFEKIL